MFVVQLHTKEVRAAMLSKLIGVLLTKNPSGDLERLPCPPSFFRAFRVKAFAERRSRVSPFSAP
jgi:hypothetical protein